MGFFTEHGAYTTNARGEPRVMNRLDRRFDHIIAPHLDHIRGKRVLDLAAHDGHWSWAALQSGAAYVHGVEGREELVDRAHRIFEDRGIARDRYDFTCSDIFDALEDLRESFDTILCLGVFYHVLDHYRLLRLMAAAKPAAIVLDTAVLNEDDAVIRLAREDTAASVNAIPRYEGQTDALIGTVSHGALRLLAEEVGYRAHFVPWDFSGIDFDADIQDYKSRTRVTALLTPTSTSSGAGGMAVERIARHAPVER